MSGPRRVRYGILGGLVLLALAFVALRTPAITGRLEVDNPRFDIDLRYSSDLAHPSVVRFVSVLGGRLDQPCFGLVTEAEEGIPREVLNLTALYPELGSTFSDFLAHDGFAIAERLFVDADARPVELIEHIGDGELASRILSPVDITKVALDREERLIVGVSVNYHSHLLETDGDGERFVFPKPVEPRGAYQPVVPSRRGHVDAGMLLDYEAEIGFVVLEEIDLGAPPMPEELFDRIALFVANDVTDRLPQILLGKPGYTRAKSHAGYLAVGPWMVHGKHLDFTGRNGDPQDIDLHLRVREVTPHPGGEARQSASSRDLMRKPWEIVEMLGEIHERSAQVDNEGVERVVARVRDGRATLPAGTIVLTGTPHGTAIEAPGPWDRVRAITRANFSMTQARRSFARHCVDHRKEMGYLSVGDTVETWADHLGRQRWSVVSGSRALSASAAKLRASFEERP